MVKINLVIADTDKDYLQSFASFLMDRYPQKFIVNSFSDFERFKECMIEKSKETVIQKADIILVAKDFYDRLKGSFNGLLTSHDWSIPVILLADEKNNSMETTEESGKMSYIYKYQYGDKLVKDIIQIYEDKCDTKGEQVDETKEEKQNLCNIKQGRTKIISVFSPAGGAGKTTIAVNASILCALNGLKVFYLNFESISSEPCFFDCSFRDKDYENLSNVIFAIKGKNKNLSARIEAAKFSDVVYNVHYIMPPDSALEMAEILPDDAVCLLHHITDSGYYDVVFIDMTSILDEKNISLMEESDEVILVHTPGRISKQKLIHFFKELKLYRNRDIDLSKKVTLIVNKYEERFSKQIKEDIDELCSIIGETRCMQYIKVPFNDKYGKEGKGGGDKVCFNEGLYKLIERYVG